MTCEIFIIGAIADNPAKQDLIQRLIAKDRSITWDWLCAPENTALPPRHEIEKLVNKLRNPGGRKITVVKLKMLDGKTANRLYRECKTSKGASIVLPPVSVKTIDDLVTWIFSAEANLVPRSEWFVNVEEAALLALLSKLLRKKYWNKDNNGHEWLKEAPLLNQSPVKDPDRGSIRTKALEILRKLKAAEVLLTKGAGGGNTPKEWSINSKYLPVIKRSFVLAKFDPLADVEELTELVFSIMDSSDERDINAFDKIVNSTTMEICRDTREDSDDDTKEDLAE